MSLPDVAWSLLISGNVWLRDLFLDFLKIHGSTFATPTATGRRWFDLKTFIDQPAHIDEGAQKNNADQKLLNHKAKV